MQRVLCVVGARPNFMKMAPVMAELRIRKDQFAPLLVHTGQHYDPSMSDAFFTDLAMPAADINLKVRSGSHGRQTGRIMIEFEAVVERERPDWVVVAGDVNSTMAAALVASKMGVRIAHVEAGLRSFDRTMPEEINRIVTDALSDLLLTPSRDGDDNLLREGIRPERIRMVGNVMIDTLVHSLDRAQHSPILEMLGLESQRYCVLTLHRPSNVDSPEILAGILTAIASIQREFPVAFPVHPRTRARLESFGMARGFPALENFKLMEPLGYLDFLKLYSNSRLVLTDSGGIQEETTALGIPCLTLRDNTERPVTVTRGTNRVIGNNPERIRKEAEVALEVGPVQPDPPDLWDGFTAPRIVDALLHASGQNRQF